MPTSLDDGSFRADAVAVASMITLCPAEHGALEREVRERFVNADAPRSSEAVG